MKDWKSETNMEKTLVEILEILKKQPIDISYVEEEIEIKERTMTENNNMEMIIDSGAPLSLIS